MPPLNKRQRIAKNINRNTAGDFITVAEVTESPEVNDFILLQDLTEDSEAPTEERQAVDSYPIKWNKEAAKGSRGPYFGFGRTTKWDYKQRDARKAKGSKTLDEFFLAAPSSTDADLDLLPESIDDDDILPIIEEKTTVLQEAHDAIIPFVIPKMDQSHEINTMSDYQCQKYRAVHNYFIKRIQGIKKIKASQETANEIFILLSKYCRPFAIRFWAKEFIQHGTISIHQQGKHAKCVSFLDHEDIQLAARNWFLTTKPEKRSIQELATRVNMVIIPQALGVPGNISMSALCNYMHEWGFMYRRHKKDIYFDGHERPDVVAYRQEWAQEMMKLKKFMDNYEGEEEEVVVSPELPDGAPKIVMVIHDEATFFSNKSRDKMWQHEDKSPIRKRTPGGSIMISEFQCPYHGTMRIRAWSTRKFFEAGTNREGYWNSDNLHQQLIDDAIPLFENLHPGCQAVFLFDQSSNHRAYASDALVASRLILSDKDLSADKEPIMKEGWYTDGNKRISQPLYKSRIVKKKKTGTIKEVKVWTALGVQSILEGRSLGLWDKYKKEGKHWKAKCGEKEPNDDATCCPFHMLEAQPDFKEQRSKLHEAVEDAGHICMFYPKYHCKTNWIERYWGGAKAISRRECDYSFASLRNNLPSFLNRISPAPIELEDGSVFQPTPTKIRWFYKRCW
ncbi:hypothetical protein INT45_003016 [Circinella minor]|uniref:DDE-1 domain-containing protein n=1 Tax=Circinella minor TaxID=1195481 RepID=A0A8H7RHC9_9FUNG|nr:hypothetical protein INT45_003016 [Circinella minor]